jgi:hypothetical protein
VKKTNSLLEHNIISIETIQNIIKYIKERECMNGGYCFYRQEEPNSSDTYYAIATQNMLENDFKMQNKTVSYLKNIQNPDGSYFSLIQAYYTVKALSTLLNYPTIDPRNYVLKHLQSFKTKNLPTEISVFRKIYYLISLANTLKIPLGSELKENILDFVFLFNNKDYGFGNSNKSTLIETMQALQILVWIKFPINKIKNVERFVSKCNNPTLSFTNIPQISPSFIEHVNAGFVASRILSLKPKFLKTSINFIKGCQTTLGGFSRAPFTGIATLEYTYYALNTLHLIAEIV